MDLFCNQRISRTGICLLLFFISAGLWAQKPQQVAYFQNKFPEAHMIRLKNQHHLDISLERGEVEVTREILEEDLYLDQAATQNSKRSLDFSTFFELENIKASSFHFHKNKYRERKVEKFTEKDELEDSFYDDTKSINFIFPDLQPGSKSRISYSEKIKNPRLLGPFFFRNYTPIASNSFRIEVDKDIAVKFLEFNMDSVPVVYSEKERGGKKIYSWSTGEMEEYQWEENSPSLRKSLPHIIPVITGYKNNGVQNELLGEVDDLYSWYYSMVESLNSSEASPELKDLVEDLVRGKKNDLEKVREIYYWVQKNIKYIAFEYALGGFIPREAEVVYKNKFGDCKDNSSILQEMLSLAGIEGNLAWIGTRDIPYTYDQVPTPLVDNHMILVFENNGKNYFLDATGRYGALGMPSSFIQGKQALVSYGKDHYQIMKVPVIPAKENAIIEFTELSISDGTITGEATARISGYCKTDFFNHLESISDESTLEEFYKLNFQKGNNKFLIRSFTEQGKFEYDGEYEVGYTFDVADYAQEIGSEVYVNLNLNRSVSSYRVPSDRKTSIEYDYKKFFKYTNVLNLPEGYQVAYLPENESFGNDQFRAEISYDQQEDQILYTHTFLLDTLEQGPEEFKSMNQLIDQVEKAYKEVIILEKK